MRGKRSEFYLKRVVMCYPAPRWPWLVLHMMDQYHCWPGWRLTAGLDAGLHLFSSKTDLGPVIWCCYITGAVVQTGALGAKAQDEWNNPLFLGLLVSFNPAETELSIKGLIAWNTERPSF